MQKMHREQQIGRNTERNVDRLKSMLLTLLCAIVILGVGYGVIVESGKKILEKERSLEETVYENTSSNIFYGKIDEDIELFPWNYFPEGQEAGNSEEIPRFLIMMEWNWDTDAEMSRAQDQYLYGMIGWQAGVSAEKVAAWYSRNQKNIMGNMVQVENSPVGSMFFYQDNLRLGKKQYQVRVASGYWNIVSFTCMENREGQERDRKAWEAGKDKLVGMLETSEDRLEEYFSYMMRLSSYETVILYDQKSGEYISTYLTGLRWLEGILQKKKHAFYYVPENDKRAVLRWLEVLENEETEYSSQKLAGEGNAAADYILESLEQAQPSFSYQIVELKDVILLLMQGEQTLGLYYDPIGQKFCGFNYFYEY